MEDWHDGPPKVRFSGTEALHLAVGVAVLTYCFAMLRAPLVETPADLARRMTPEPIHLLAAFLAVTTGFVLHELAHKVVAQRYGYWAEFRAQFPSLGLSLLMAVFTPLLVAAPGAVLIQGRVTARESGIISLVGPALNFVVALAALPFARGVNPDAPVPLVFGMVALVNAVLAAFNLLPFGPLDGRKVLRWSKPVWAACFLATGGLVVLAFLLVPA
ncbi:MAG: hypothetical protein QOD77_791 [Thermoplasmata archaeon]|jgi:Zn-dependent protease|nr:hypothetical protein [Thermoplasmata archaeon]